MIFQENARHLEHKNRSMQELGNALNMRHVYAIMNASNKGKINSEKSSDYTRYARHGRRGDRYCIASKCS